MSPFLPRKVVYGGKRNLNQIYLAFTLGIVDIWLLTIQQPTIHRESVFIGCLKPVIYVLCVDTPYYTYAACVINLHPIHLLGGCIQAACTRGTSNAKSVSLQTNCIYPGCMRMTKHMQVSLHPQADVLLICCTGH